jgi:hypothetical protein
MDHVLNDFAVRGLGSLTVLQLHTFFGYVCGARFKHGKTRRG